MMVFVPSGPYKREAIVVPAMEGSILGDGGTRTNINPPGMVVNRKAEILFKENIRLKIEDLGF
jgi:hypothetical protein